MQLLISNNEIKNAIKLFADKINSNYQNKEVIIIAILKGSVLFLRDLFEYLDFENSMDDFVATVRSFSSCSHHEMLKICIFFKSYVRTKTVI